MISRLKNIKTVSFLNSKKKIKLAYGTMMEEFMSEIFQKKNQANFVDLEKVLNAINLEIAIRDNLKKIKSMEQGQ